MKKGILVFTIMGLLFTFPVFSQNNRCSCDSVLITTIVEKNHSIDKELAILDMVDRSNFEEFRRINSGSGDAGLSLPGIVDFNIGGSATYEEFKQKRDKIFKLYKFNSRSNEDFKERIKYLPDYVVAGWTECKYICSRIPGIIGYIETTSPEYVIVKFKWFPYPNDRGNHRITAQRLVGGVCAYDNVDKNKIFPDKYKFGVLSETTRVITRGNNSEILMTLDVDGTSGFIVVPKFDFHKFLFDGIESGSTSHVMQAINKGVSVNAKKANGETAINYAIGKGNTNVFLFLVNHKDILINNRGYLGATALYNAAASQDLGKTKLLLSKKANPNIAINDQNYQGGIYYGWTPLSSANYINATNPNAIIKEIIEELIKHGAVDGRHAKVGVIL